MHSICTYLTTHKVSVGFIFAQRACTKIRPMVFAQQEVRDLRI